MFKYLDFQEADIIKAFGTFQKRIAGSDTPLALCDMARVRAKMNDLDERILYVCCKDIFDSVSPTVLRYPTPNIDWEAEKRSCSDADYVEAGAWEIDARLVFGNIPVVNPPWMTARHPSCAPCQPGDEDEPADIRARIIVDVKVSERSERPPRSDAEIDKLVTFRVRERIGKNYGRIMDAHVDWFGGISELRLKRRIYGAVAEFLRKHGECKA